MNRKLLFLTLLLVGLCLCSASLNLFSRRSPDVGSLDLQAPSLDQVRSRLTVKLKGADLALKSGEGCAVQRETLLAPQGAVCVFVIPASDSLTRQLVLTLRSPAISAALNLTQPKAIPVDKTLTPGEEPYAIDIYRNPDKPDALLTIRDCRVPQPTNDEQPDLPRLCIFEIRK